MELDVRGTPLWQMRTYLERMGLEEGADGAFLGPGVRVTLEESEHRAFGTVVPRVIVRFVGPSATVEPLVARLRLWATRVGG